jgi:bacillithiol system protein YtxJ
MEQFDEIDEISQSKPVVLFKHSTRCSISRMALKQFDTEFNYPEEKIDWYLLDLLNHRDLSNEIANRYNVVHQSPQIVVIRNGKAVFNESHDSISAEDLKQFT